MVSQRLNIPYATPLTYTDGGQTHHALCITRRLIDVCITSENRYSYVEIGVDVFLFKTVGPNLTPVAC
jgi:hypothetical protein